MSSPSTKATRTGNEGDSHQSQQPELTTNPVVLELVYKKLVSSLSIDVACQMHRMMKTGVYPSSELLVPKSRSEIYPEIYSNKQKDIKKEEKQYSVFIPQRNKRKRLGEKDENDPIESYLRSSSNANTTRSPKGETVGEIVSGDQGISPEKARSNPPADVPSSDANAPQLKPQSYFLDIWGKAPPKEPKEMVECLICGRQVNTLRFAPHLDKCMGIGTTVRAAALAASGFVPQTSVGSSAVVARASFSGGGLGNIK